MKKIVFTKFPHPVKTDRAVRILHENGILIHPTENLYGFGAKFFANKAISRISNIKKRTQSKGYITLIGERKQLQSLVRSVNPKQQELIDQFWPGPLTIIFSVQERYLDHPAVIDGTIAVRYVGNPITRKIIKQAHSPIISTSINISGKDIINDESEITKLFSQSVQGFVVDTIHKFTAKPSTIVEVKNNTVKIIRSGVLELA